MNVIDEYDWYIWGIIEPGIKVIERITRKNLLETFSSVFMDHHRPRIYPGYIIKLYFASEGLLLLPRCSWILILSPHDGHLTFITQRKNRYSKLRPVVTILKGTDFPNTIAIDAYEIQNQHFNVPFKALFIFPGMYFSSQQR